MLGHCVCLRTRSLAAVHKSGRLEGRNGRSQPPNASCKVNHLGETLEADLSVLLARARLEAARFHRLSLRLRHLLRVTENRASGTAGGRIGRGGGGKEFQSRAGVKCQVNPVLDCCRAAPLYSSWGMAC